MIRLTGLTALYEIGVPALLDGPNETLSFERMFCVMKRALLTLHDEKHARARYRL